MDFINRKKTIITAFITLLTLSPVAHPVPVALELPLQVATAEQALTGPTVTQTDVLPLELTLDVDSLAPGGEGPQNWRELEQLALSSPPAVLDFIVIDAPEPSTARNQFVSEHGSDIGLLPLLGSLLLLGFGLSVLLGQLGGHRMRHVRPFQHLRYARTEFKPK